ncbi:MAG: S8 family serine peptidase [Planctomycetota bacterium]
MNQSERKMNRRVCGGDSTRGEMSRTSANDKKENTMIRFFTSKLLKKVQGFAVAGVFTIGGTVVNAERPLDRAAGKGETAVVDFVQAPQMQKLANLESSAIDSLAAAMGFDRAGLSIAHSSVANFPSLGLEAFSYKVMDAEGNLHGVMIDENGFELDTAAVQQSEKEAYEATYGKLHPDLLQALPVVAGDETVPVIIWLSGTEDAAAERPDPSVRLSKSEGEALTQQIEFQRSEAVRLTVEPLANSLAEAGFNVSVNEQSPVVYAELDPATIDEVSRISNVDMIYLDTQNEANLATARVVVRADIVNARGFTGSGVRVGEIEVGGRIATANPYLAGVVQDLLYSCVHWHATAVAGMIRSTHGTQRGIAPNATLWVGGSCGGWGSELQNRATACADWGARAINNSWGSTSNSQVPDANARFFDDMVINRWRTIVFAAGNRGGAGCSQGTDGVVTNPAIAYNVIAVGNIDDRGTTGTGDDIMSGCSSWKDPLSTHGDREKPEVSAPGTNITSTDTASPWINNMGSGTSYSAPMVTGTAALMIQRNSSLGVWPEAVKAILMATALQNVEGASRLSEKDGAGGINADRADDVVRGVNGSWGAQSYSCSAAASTDVMNMSLVAGKRTRVCIVFDTDPTYGSYTSQPCADLDLQVISPTNTVVTSSLSYDNTYEIVDFTPSTTGTYKIRVNKFRCDMSPKYLGFAYYRLP